MKFNVLLAVSLSMLLSACALPVRTPLPDTARNNIQSVRAHIGVIQDEVIVDVTPSLSTGAGAAFGVIGAIISSAVDSSITNSRMKSTQSLMEEFYSRIDDIDVRKSIAQAVAQSVAEYPIKITEVVTSPRFLTVPEIQAKIAGFGPHEAFLVVYPRYRLSGDYRYLMGVAGMTIWTKGNEQPQYRGQAIYQSEPLGPGGAASLAQWSENSAAKFRTALNEAVSELTHMIMSDVRMSTQMDPKDVKTYKLGIVSLGIPVRAEGKVISEIPGRVRVLGKDGFYFSLPSNPAH